LAFKLTWVSAKRDISTRWYATVIKEEIRRRISHVVILKLRLWQVTIRPVIGATPLSTATLSMWETIAQTLSMF
jgi:hypothetical protein